MICPRCQKVRHSTGQTLYCSCGAVVAIDGTIERTVAVTIENNNAAGSVETSKCLHRGGKIRREWCGPCNGNRTVFACGIYGECSFGNLAGVKCCTGCEDKTTDQLVASARLIQLHGHDLSRTAERMVAERQGKSKPIRFSL